MTSLDKKSLLVSLVFLKAILVYLIFLISPNIFEFSIQNYKSNFHYPYKDPISWYSSFVTWDARFYWYIAENSYHNRLAQAFYPLFPGLMKIIGNVTGNPLSGFILVNLFLVSTVLMLHEIIKQKFSLKVSNLSILLLLLYPSSFFFHALYSESLFLFLAVGFFYCWYREKILLASICLLLIPLCRPNGVLMVLPVLYLLYKNENLKLVQKGNILCLPVVGFVLAQLIIGAESGNWLSSFQAQEPFHAKNSILNLFMLHEWFQRNFLDINLAWHGTNNSIYDRLLFFCFICLLPFIWKYQSKEFFIFTLMMGLIPALTGTIMSYNRFLIVCFPVFIQLAILFDKNTFGRIVNYLLMLAMLFLQIYFTFLYSLNKWVA